MEQNFGICCSQSGMEIGISSSVTIAECSILDFVVGTSQQMTMFHLPVALLLQVPVSPHEALPIDALDLVAEAHARLHVGEITNAMYGRIIMSDGFNYVAGGLPYDMVLRTNGVDVFQAARKDWMHSALQDGLLTVDCHLYVAACQHQIRPKRAYGTTHLRL